MNRHRTRTLRRLLRVEPYRRDRGWAVDIDLGQSPERQLEAVVGGDTRNEALANALWFVRTVAQ